MPRGERRRLRARSLWHTLRAPQSLWWRVFQARGLPRAASKRVVNVERPAAVFLPSALAALPVYSDHPAHLAVVQDMLPVREDIVAFDYIVE